MTEYFRPSKIWVGKLCYVQINWRGDLLLPCKISCVAQAERCLRVEVVFGGDSCDWVDADLIFDRIDGATIFHDIPGGKP